MIYLTTADTLRRARLALGRITKAKQAPITGHDGRASLALYKRRQARVARLVAHFEKRFGPAMMAELTAKQKAAKFADFPGYQNPNGAKRLVRWARTTTYEAS